MLEKTFMEKAMNPTQAQTQAHELEEGEMNLVAEWLRVDPTRWIAGAIAGVFAGVMMLALGMVFATAFGQEAMYPFKVAAVPFLGGHATDLTNGSAIFIGLLAQSFFSGIWGVIFSHFVFTNSRAPLLAMGLVWGIFNWIFVHNLFMRAFPDYLALDISSGVTIFCDLFWGISLTSVAVFDRMLRKK